MYQNNSMVSWPWKITTETEKLSLDALAQFSLTGNFLWSRDHRDELYQHLGTFIEYAKEKSKLSNKVLWYVVNVHIIPGLLVSCD